MNDQKISQPERAVLYVLAYHDGDQGVYVSQRTIEREANLSHTTALDARRRLKKRGLIDWTSGNSGGMANRYQLNYGLVVGRETT